MLYVELAALYTLGCVARHLVEQHIAMKTRQRAQQTQTLSPRRVPVR